MRGWDYFARDAFRVSFFYGREKKPLLFQKQDVNIIFSCQLLVAQMVQYLPTMQEFNPWVRKIS